MTLAHAISPFDAAHDPLILRSACASDFAAIRNMHRTTFAEHMEREENFSGQSLFIETFINDLRCNEGMRSGIMSNSRSAILVVQMGDKTVGHLAYRCDKLPWQPPTCYIADISIEQPFRRIGLGHSLLREVEAREPGTRRFWAGIWPGNRASHALFEGQGYEIRPNRSTPNLIARKFVRTPAR
jgi:ribosomal protein S18 acetylase RimI-like enzyme